MVGSPGRGLLLVVPLGLRLLLLLHGNGRRGSGRGNSLQQLLVFGGNLEPLVCLSPNGDCRLLTAVRGLLPVTIFVMHFLASADFRETVKLFLQWNHD